jgi:hypothetical protein
MTAASVDEDGGDDAVSDAEAPLDLASEPEIPEALESSELLDDVALESIPDAEELA